MQLVGDLDHTTGVHHVVRGVQDRPVGQVLLDTRVCQLVVGRAAHHLGGERGNALVVQGAAERARGVDVEPLGADQSVRVRGHGDVGVQLGDRAYGLLAHIRHDDLGTVAEQVCDEVAADLADPGNADLAAAQRGVAPHVLGGGPHPLEDAERGEDGGVARAAVLGGPAGGPAALPGDDVHVRDIGADVARGHVAPAERRHEAAVGQEQCLGLDQLRVADDHGLAAAVVEAGHGVLVRHAARQVQRVRDGFLFGGVRVEAGPAEGRAQSGGVQGDDGLEAAGAVLADHDLLVATLIGVEQGVHYIGRYTRYAGHIGHCGDSQVRSGGEPS